MDPQRVRLLAVAVAVALVVLVGVIAAGGKKGERPGGGVVISMKTPTPKATARTGGTPLSIEALLNQTPPPVATPGGLPEPERDAEGAQDAMRKGEMAWTTGNLFEARKQYTMAVRMDPKCTSCAEKLDNLERKIVSEINDAMTAGERQLETGRYDQAVFSFERVLDLDPDKSSPYNMNASRLLEDAKAKRDAGRR